MCPTTRATPLVTGVLTNGSGDYSFTGLAPGNYIVRVDQDNFDAGGNTSLVATPISPVTIARAAGSGRQQHRQRRQRLARHRPAGLQPGDHARLQHRARRTAAIRRQRHQQHARLRLLQQPAAGDQQSRRRHRDLHRGRRGGRCSTTARAPEVAATVTDDQANLNGGSLTVSITANEVAGEDVLGISTAGTVTLSNGTNIGSVVSVGGLAIGTVTANGTNGNDLVITFNTTNATPANVSTLVQALSYSNSNTLNPSTAAAHDRGHRQRRPRGHRQRERRSSTSSTSTTSRR